MVEGVRDKVLQKGRCGTVLSDQMHQSMITCFLQTWNCCYPKKIWRHL